MHKREQNIAESAAIDTILPYLEDNLYKYHPELRFCIPKLYQ
jgi:hypothetical protein